MFRLSIWVCLLALSRIHWGTGLFEEDHSGRGPCASAPLRGDLLAA